MLVPLSALVGLWNFGLDLNCNMPPALNLVADPNSQCELDVTSTIFGDPIVGFWDDDSCKLTFSRVTGDPQGAQVFTGYLLTNVDGASCNYLAGFYESFKQPNPQLQAGSCERSVFGWFAQKV